MAKPPAPAGPSRIKCNYCAVEVDDGSHRVKRVTRLNGDEYVWHWRCWEEAVIETLLPIYGDPFEPI